MTSISKIFLTEQFDSTDHVNLDTSVIFKLIFSTQFRLFI
jgi:hypothetical protein